jgi:MFS transporter, ACS family, tartrate transporter
VRAKTAQRILPFVCLLFILSFLDRVNLSYAAFDMARDLRFSAEVYGLGAAIFFAGYLLFEIPASVLVERFSAYTSLAVMMVAWGIAAGLMGFIRSKGEFYTLRILLGIAESGFFPGIIVYLSHWFVRADRARAIGALAVGLPLANLLGAPLSGSLLRQQWLSLPGWRWMFILEGLPSVVAGVLTLRYLTDTPQEASWLSMEEREHLTALLEAEKTPRPERTWTGLGTALAQRRLFLLAAIWFLDNLGVYGFNFWLPMIIKRLSGLSAATVNTVAAIPFIGALAAAALLSRSSDRRRERRWHTALSMVVFAVGLAASAFYSSSPMAAFAMLCVAALGLTSGTPAFWGLATEAPTTAGAIPIAAITSAGVCGGFCGPYLMGVLRSATNGFSAGLSCLAAAVFLGAALVFTVGKQSSRLRTDF